MSKPPKQSTKVAKPQEAALTHELAFAASTVILADVWSRTRGGHLSGTLA